MSATHHMEMQVENGLASIPSGIRNETETRFRQTFVFCDSCAGQQQPSKQRLVGFTKVLHGLHMPFRNDQRVNGSLRVDIVERQGVLVLIHNFGRDTSLDNPAENTGAHPILLHLLLGSDSGFAEPFTQFLIDLLKRHIVIAQDHECMEKQVGHFVDNLVFLSSF